MTSMLGKFTFVIAAVGGLNLMAFSPAPVEAGVIHPSPGLAAASGDSNVMRVRCVRSLSNLWSCNDDVRAQDRYTYSPRGRQVPCERSLWNLWSCNDDVRVQDRRGVQARDRYAYHPCDHSWQTARDGSRCGNRAADRRPGGR